MPHLPAIVDHVRAALADRGITDPRCPLCNAAGWDAVQTRLVVPYEGVAGGAALRPRVELVCQTCGHITILDGEALGIQAR